MEVKPPSTFKEQLNKLHERGCLINDDYFAEEILHQINYYRLTAYFLPFKQDDGKYQPLIGTTWG